MSTGHSIRDHGFTLAELLVTVSVAGILLALGVPALTTLVAGARMRAEINDVVTLVHLARSEAVKRATDVILCPSEDGSACLDDPHWHLGCLLFADPNGNRERDEDEPVIRHRGGEATAAVAITSSEFRRLIRYRPDGTAGGNTITVTFCDVSDDTPPRALIISNVGRPRVSRRAPDGGALDCS
jgi:type IV fimbrial biogenesis protein FimT